MFLREMPTEWENPNFYVKFAESTMFKRRGGMRGRPSGRQHAATGQFWPPTEEWRDPEELVYESPFEPFEEVEPEDQSATEGQVEEQQEVPRRSEPEGEAQPDPLGAIPAPESVSAAAHEPETETPMEVEVITGTAERAEAAADKVAEIAAPEPTAVLEPAAVSEPTAATPQIAITSPKAGEERPPPENFPRAWYCPQSALTSSVASVIPAPVSTEPLRRPAPAVAEPMEVAASEESRETDRAREEWVRTGAIPRRLVSTEERESRAAERDLEQYLQGGRDNPEGMAEVIIVEAPRPAPSRFLPVESGPVVFNEENWDDDAPTAAPIAIQRAPAPEPQSLPIPEPRRRHKCKGRASRYNPRRHLERGDFESVVPDRSERQASPPSDSENRRAWSREREPMARESRPRAQLSRGLGAPSVRLEGVKFGNLTPIPTDARVDPPAYTCFNCWQEGHCAMQCQRPRVRNFCYNCGRSGVDMTVCPRCSAAYRRMVGRESRESSGRANSRPYQSEPRRERRVSFAPDLPREQWTPRENWAQPFPARVPLAPRAYAPPQWAPPPSRYDSGPRNSVWEAIRVLEETRRMSDDTREGLIRRLYL